MMEPPVSMPFSGQSAHEIVTSDPSICRLECAPVSSSYRTRRSELALFVRKRRSSFDISPASGSRFEEQPILATPVTQWNNLYVPAAGSPPVAVLATNAVLLGEFQASAVRQPNAHTPDEA